MRQVYEQVAQVARTNTTVLLRGESGTGKELIAHAIHYNSPRAKKPFIKVSCAALPQDLIESELFGYEKGAFTGAHGPKKGRFEIGRRRHAVPGRDRRAEPRDAGQAAARPAGARVRAAGRHGPPSASTCGWSPPPTRTSRRRSPPASSGRTSTTGSTSSRSSSRRCASGSPTSCCWPITFSRSSRASTARTSGASRRRRSTC